MKETPDIMFALQDPSCHFKSLNNSGALSFSMLLFMPMMIVLRIDSLGTVVATKILASMMQNEALRSIDKHLLFFFSIRLCLFSSKVQIYNIMEFYIIKFVSSSLYGISLNLAQI